MSNKTNKYNVSVISKEEVSLEDAMLKFGIKSISIPTDSKGNLVNIKNNFLGSVSIELTHGAVINITLMKSKREDAKNKAYLAKSHSDSVFINNELRNDLVPVGNSYGYDRANGTRAYIASTHIPSGMWDFIVQYTLDAIKDKEIVERDTGTRNFTSQTNDEEAAEA